MSVRLAAEALLAGVDLSGVDDINEAPEAAEYDVLRALSAEALAAQFQAAWPDLAGQFDLRAGEVRLDLALEDVRVLVEP